MKKSHLILLAAGAVVLAGCNTYREQMGHSKQVSFNQLPQAAQTTVRNEIGDKPIARVDEDTRYGEPAYRVEVEAPGLNPAIWVAPDGSIIKESRRLVSQRPMSEAAGAQTKSTMPASTNSPSGTTP